MATYLVTGAAGFIGARVAKLLLENGDSVVGVDNLCDYYDVSLKRHRLKLLEEERFQFCFGDIEDQRFVQDVFDRHRFDAVLNLAARAGVRYSVINPHVYLSTNAVGSLNLLEQMRRYQVGKFVLASTSSLYAGLPMPFDEDLHTNTPISPYAASKKAAEVLAYTYNHLYGIDVSVCRYFTVYGPAGRPDMGYFRFIKWIDRGEPIELFGNGEQARDFTYVDDIARGTIAALRNVGYEIINLGGGGTPITLNQLIGDIEALLGKKAKIARRDSDKTDMVVTQAGIEKAGRLLEWRPRVDFAEGLEKCVAWHQDNKPWSAQIELP